MEKTWIEIEKIDERIAVNRRVHDRIKSDIRVLEVQLENVNIEFKELNAQKLYLGKKAYGDPEIRRGLIERGEKCSNRTVRQAAERLREENTDVKWGDDVKMELINACALLDRAGSKRIVNPNFSDYLAKVGKLGYVRTTNY